MGLFDLFAAKSADPNDPIEALYRIIMRQSRQPSLFAACAIPDTPDGRYDILAVHVHMALRRIKDQGDDAQAAAQALFDLMFRDMDTNLREMGIGDMGIAPRIKKLAQGFYGRMESYDAGLDADDGEATLIAALERNVYRHGLPEDGDAVRCLARYVRRQHDHVATQPVADVIAGRIAFMETDAALAGEGA